MNRGRFTSNCVWVAGALAWATPVAAQQNPIISATQAPAPVAAGPYGPAVGGYPYGAAPYGAAPYGSGYPYANYNPALAPITNPAQNSQQGAVPSAQAFPGQSLTPAAQQGLQAFSGAGGGGGAGGSAGGNAAPSGGLDAGSGGGSSTEGASFELLQNPLSPLFRRYEANSGVASPLRPQVLTQVGRGNGVRRGFVDESRRIAAAVRGESEVRLDARYDFATQMIGPNLVPPVIGEVRNVSERGGDKLLYLTLGAYQILRPARLVISPPNWRDYLLVDAAEPQAAPPALEPQDGGEQAIYDAAYNAGVERGVLEARDTFEANLNRLERDYGGMERYHALARQGAVSLPVVGASRRSVRLADGGQRAFVGERIVSLRVTPRFKSARPGAYR